MTAIKTKVLYDFQNNSHEVISLDDVSLIRDRIIKMLESIKCSAPNHDMHHGFNSGIDTAVSIVKRELL